MQRITFWRKNLSGEKTTNVKIRCEECGGGFRNHDILARHEETTSNEDFTLWAEYQICKCCGCDIVRFRRETRFSEDYDHETGVITPVISIYPDADESGRQALDMNDLPDRVNGIYHETIKALNSGALTLVVPA
jgi:hypothetical protein